MLEAESPDAAYATAVVTAALDLIVCDPVISHGRTADLWWRLHAVKPNVPFLLYAGADVETVPFTDIALRKPFSRQQLGAAVLRRLRRRPPETTQTDRPVQRIASDVLRAIRANWYDRLTGLIAPAPEAFDPAEFGVGDRSFLAEAGRNGRFRFVHVADRLTARSRRMLAGETVDAATRGPDMEETFGSLDAAYARCCRSRRPVYEYARFDLGDGAPTLFERLLLPFSSNGHAITHIAGIVLIGDRAMIAPVTD